MGGGMVAGNTAPQLYINMFGELKVIRDSEEVRLGVLGEMLALLILWRDRDPIRIEDMVEALHPNCENAMDPSSESKAKKPEGQGPSFVRKRKGRLYKALGFTTDEDRRSLSDLARLILAHATVDVVTFDEKIESRDPA